MSDIVKENAFSSKTILTLVKNSEKKKIPSKIKFNIEINSTDVVSSPKSDPILIDFHLPISESRSELNLNELSSNNENNTFLDNNSENSTGKNSKNEQGTNQQIDEKITTGRWHPDEHKKFVEGLLKYGNNWKKIQEFVGSRSCSQMRSHAQKFIVKIKKQNLLDFNIDLNKGTLKSLQEHANQMNSEQYINTIKMLNNVAYEQKASNQNKLKKLKNEDTPETKKNVKNNRKFISKNVKVVNNDNYNNLDTKINIMMGNCTKINSNLPNLNCNKNDKSESNNNLENLTFIPINSLLDKKRARTNSIEQQIYDSTINNVTNLKVEEELRSFIIDAFKTDNNFNPLEYMNQHLDNDKLFENDTYNYNSEHFFDFGE